MRELRRLLCLVLPHHWLPAGYRYRSCTRCPAIERIQRDDQRRPVHDETNSSCPIEHGFNACTCESSR